MARPHLRAPIQRVPTHQIPPPMIYHTSPISRVSIVQSSSLMRGTNRCGSLNGCGDPRPGFSSGSTRSSAWKRIIRRARIASRTSSLCAQSKKLRPHRLLPTDIDSSKKFCSATRSILSNLFTLFAPSQFGSRFHILFAKADSPIELKNPSPSSHWSVTSWHLSKQSLISKQARKTSWTVFHPHNRRQSAICRRLRALVQRRR
jgi:hypothetical protein